MNNASDVAFTARRPDGRHGVFLGPDAVNDRLILQSDQLSSKIPSDVSSSTSSVALMAFIGF